MPGPARPTLRPALPDDAEFLARVYASTRHDLHALPLPPEQQAALIAFQSRAQEQHYSAHFPGLERLIAELDGVPVGRLYRWHSEREQRLIDVALLPDVRGQKLGTWLLEHELRRAKAAGLPMRLHVEHSNPAQRLYVRLGFLLTERQDAAGVYVAMERLP